jgi:hypothetical protein
VARMTEEMKQKLAAAREETARQNQQSRQKGMAIGKWRVFRFDDLNIAIEKEGDGEDKRRYYPDFPTASIALFRLIAEPTGRVSAEQYVKVVQDAEKKILAGLASMT